MSEYEFKRTRLPVDKKWDVIVAGGGPSGCAAATAAAREGANTLLLENTSMLGGMGTAGLVPWLGGYTDGERIIARGLAEHVRLALSEGMPALKGAMEKNPLTKPEQFIDPELLKRIYDDMIVEAGLNVQFNSQVCAVDSSNSGDIEAVIVADKTGLRAFQAKNYVYCTGDGDLATWAGAEYEKGSETGAMQPASECFIITNVDEEALAEGPGIHYYDPESPIWRAVKDDKYPLIDELHSCSIKIAPRAFGFNTGHVQNIDNTSPESVSEGLIKGRRMAAQYHDLFARYLPAYKDSFLACTGSLLGIRESRRIKGDYCLTVDDFRSARHFPDEICRNAYGIDVHETRQESTDMTKLSIAELKERNRKKTRQLDKGQNVGVPYRCLTPEGLKNLLIAGRCISTDRQTNGSVRVMACCLNTGEAAGIAAAMASSEDSDIHRVDTDKLRRKLQYYGAYLPD